MKNIYVAGIVEHAGKFLMLKHKDIGKWVFAGGKPEAGETGEEALAREMNEELGIIPVAMTLHSAHVNEVKGVNWTGLFYVVPKWLGRIRVAEPKKHSAVAWVPWQEIDTQPEASIAASITGSRLLFEGVE